MSRAIEYLSATVGRAGERCGERVALLGVAATGGRSAAHARALRMWWSDVRLFGKFRQFQDAS